VTSMTLNDSTVTHSGDFSATLGSVTLQNAGTFVPQTTTGLSLTSVTVQSGGTLEQGMTTALPITTFTVQSGGNVTHTTNTTTKAYVVNITSTTVDLQSGSTVNVNGLGYTTGTGAGTNGSYASGAGYGGAGGDSSNGTAGGSTYGTATAPDELGSAGGDDINNGTGAGAKGGGAVKFTVTGTMTVDGTISADGQSGDNGEDGGGSGGSVWLAVGTYAGTGAITANGGAGSPQSASFYGGGGGGGGRIYITYTTKTYSGSTPTVTGGEKGGIGGSSAASAGSDGTFSEAAAQPTINGLLVSPTDPVSTDYVTVSASATYASGLDYLELFLDGTTSGDSIKNCDAASATDASCSTTLSPLSGGSHTAYIVAHGDDYTSATSTQAFTVSTNTTQNYAVLERYKAGSTTSMQLVFTLPYAQSTTLTITFPATFTLNSAFTTGTCAGGGTISNFGVDDANHVLTADKSSCDGTVTLSGANITLPGSSGLYTVSWVNDSPGTVIIPVTDDDQVTISADVASEIVFDLDVATSDSETAAPYTLALGTLTSGSANGSDDSAVSGVWVDLDTNATAGAVVQVKSANAALASASVPADTIASSAGDVNGSNNARYGMCVASAGLGVPSATVGTFQSVSPFDGTTGTSLGCTTTNASVGALTTGFQTVLNSNSLPIDGGRAQIRIKVDISDTTAAHDDYADTLTFRATSTF